MSFFAKLAVLISANTTEFKAGLDDANKSAKKFEAEQKKAMREAARAAKELENTLRATAQVAAVAAVAIGGALRWADEIADTADAFDVTISSLVSMRNALSLAGGNAEGMANMLQKLANQSDAAREGSDQARKSFERLGISGKEVESSNLDELFARVASALSTVEDPVTRNALAFENLGKAARGVNWKQYWEDYSTGKSSSESVSEAIKEGAEAWDNLGRAGRAALEGILVLIQPLVSFINFISKKMQEGSARPMVGSSFGAELGLEEMSMVDGGATTPPSVAAASKKKSGGYSVESAEQRAERRKKEQEEERAAKEREKFLKQLRDFAAATEEVRRQTKEIERQSEVMMRREEMQTKFLAMTKNEREIAEAIFNIEQQRDQLIANAEKELEIEKKREFVNEERVKALEDQIEMIRIIKEIEAEAITATIEKRQQEQQSFTIGWERAFAQYAEDSQNYARLGEQAFNSVISSMDQALSQFVQTGKLNFKSLAQSIIQDLIRIQLRMQLMQMFGFAKGFLGQAFGFGTQSPAPVTNALPGMFGNAADGGFISGPTLVGEQGPELFIPNRPGTVIPNQQLSSVMNNQPQIVYNGPYIQNMSAIDTQSATQFLASNKQAVYAANLSATRSLPASR